MQGRRWFIAGSVVLLLFAAVHLLAVFQSHFVPPTDPAEIEWDRAARAFSVKMGPFAPTGRDLMAILSESYSALLLFVGILNLAALGPAAAAGKLRRLTLINLIFVGLLLAITVLHPFPPPMVFAGAAWICFAISFTRQRTSLNSSPNAGNFQ